MVISNKVLYGKKSILILYLPYSCKDDGKTKPLCIGLPKINGYFKCFDETKYKAFLIKDEDIEWTQKKKKKDLIVKQCMIKIFKN